MRKPTKGNMKTTSAAAAPSNENPTGYNNMEMLEAALLPLLDPEGTLAYDDEEEDSELSPDMWDYAAMMAQTAYPMQAMAGYKMIPLPHPMTEAQNLQPSASSNMPQPGIPVMNSAGQLQMVQPKYNIDQKQKKAVSKDINNSYTDDSLSVSPAPSIAEVYSPYSIKADQSVTTTSNIADTLIQDVQLATEIKEKEQLDNLVRTLGLPLAPDSSRSGTSSGLLKSKRHGKNAASASATSSTLTDESSAQISIKTENAPSNLDELLAKPVKHQKPVDIDAVIERNKKNAIQARINRQKKKDRGDQLQQQIDEMKDKNDILEKKVGQLVQDKNEMANEIHYLRNVLANQSMLAGLLKNINHTPNLQLRSSFYDEQPSVGSKRHADDGADAPAEKISKQETVPPSAGVCLHVDQQLVSLEFCSTCSTMAHRNDSSPSSR